MKRIAPDVERLMWLIAEESDPRAVTDFEARFPDLRAELAKRMAMVAGLKTAGRKVPAREIPRFEPRYPKPLPAPNRSLYVALAFVLGAVAFGAYSATTLLTNPVPKPPPVQPVKTNPVQLPNVVTTPFQSPTVTKDPVDTKQEPAPAVAEKLDPMDNVVTFKGERAPLTAAIAMVCKSAGITVELAPGVAEDEVELNYEGWTAKAVLEDLGQKHGFSVFPQQHGSVLIIPARRDGGPTKAEPDSAPSLLPDSDSSNKNGMRPTKTGSISGQ